MNLLKFDLSLLQTSCFDRFGNLVACLKYVVLHLFNCMSSLTRRRKKNEMELKSKSEGERQKLPKKMNFRSDVVNWRSLVKNQQED